MIDTTLIEAAVASAGLHRGRVAEVGVDGTLEVMIDETAMTCQQLVTSRMPVVIRVGDQVLVWQPAASPRSGVVLGVLESAATSGRVADGIPESLVIEAKQSLTLCVGEGSITIREDGKILIKGKDLVSHAQRMNRIKGGAVSIN